MRARSLPRRPRTRAALIFALVVALLPFWTAVPAQAAAFTLTVAPRTSGTNAVDTDCPTQVPGSTVHCSGSDTDLSAADLILRTNDPATIRYTYTSGGPETGVILSGTLSGGALWGPQPAACLSYSGANTATMSCTASNITAASVNAIDFTLSIPVSVGDGVTQTVSASRVKSASNSTGNAGTSTVAYTSSARPEWNLAKDGANNSANTLPAPSLYRDPDGNLGYLTFSPFGIRSARAYGNSGLPVNGVTFYDNLTGYTAAQRAGTRLVTWGGYGNGCGNAGSASPGGTVRVNVTNQLGSGGFTPVCTQAAAGDRIQVVLNNVNTNANSGSFILIGWIALFTPLTTVPAGTSTLGDRYEDFDPNDRQGANNYGANTAGDCTGTTAKAGCEALTDNSRTVQVTNAQLQSGSKTLQVNPAGAPTASFQPGSTPSSQYPLAVDAGNTLGSALSYNNTGTGNQNNVVLCDKVDTTTQTLTAWPGGAYGVVLTKGTNDPTNFVDAPAWYPAAGYNGTDNFAVDPSAYVLEYGVGDYGTSVPATDADVTNAACTDAGSPIGWFTSPTAAEIAAYADGRGITALEAVTKVRVRFLQTIQPTQSVALKVLTTVRTAFRPDSGALSGTTIYGTTRIKDAEAYRADELNPNYVKLGVPPVIINGLAQGTAQATVTKAANKTTVTAGDEITYTLTPRVTYVGDRSEINLRAFDLIPPDLTYIEGSNPAGTPEPTLVLPQTDGATLLVWDLGYDPPTTGTLGYRVRSSATTPNGTALLNDAVVEARNRAGAQVDARDLPYNGTFCPQSRPYTVKDVPATPSVPTASTVTLTKQGADVTGGGCGRTRNDQVKVTLANSAVLGVTKTPLRGRIQVGEDNATATPVGWQLKYVNLSSDPLPAIDAIDVLPYNGDGRTPATTFTGTLTLTSLTTTDTVSTTPNTLPITADGGSQPRTGTTFYYTSATPASISSDPNNAKNLVGGSTTWCLQTAFGTAGCPANLAAVTAYRVISGNLNTGVQRTVTAGFATDGDADGNVFTNAAVVRARGLTAPGPSNDSPITVVGAALGGRLWDDANNNGVIDTGETLLAGVAVRLLNSGGTEIASTTTSATGTYNFPGLLAGTYTAQVVPGAVIALYPGLTPTWDTDSLFVNPDERITVTLSEGVKNTTSNFGYSSSSLSGFVFLDDNADGRRTAADTNLGGVTLTLTGTTTGGAAVSRTTTSAATTGAWTFADLQPGTYTVTETQPTAYLDGPDRAGTAGGTVGNDVISAITLAPGVKATNYLFSEYTPNVLSGRVFSDNGDGTFNGTDAGIEGVSVRLTGTDGTGAAVDRTVQTAADGTYAFTGLKPGTYTVTETQPAGYADGIDRAGTAGGTVTNDRVSAINLTGSTSGYTFAELRPAITMTKTAQGLAADTQPGPYVLVGDSVRFVLTATNTGSAPLTNVTFDDDVPGSRGCPVTATLAAGDTAVCTITVPAFAGQQQNLATVRATTAAYTGPDGATADPIAVTANDLANYFGVRAALTIDKRTQAQNPTAAPGPAVFVGRPVRWTYAVTNPNTTGAVTITNIAVTDNKLTAADINCGSGSNVIASLAPGATVTCTASGSAAPGQYTNTGSAAGSGPQLTAADGTTAALPVTASDASYYYGAQSGVEITKTVNGTTATTGSGPNVTVGDTVRFRYTVRNIGNTDLTAVTVTDDRIAATGISCAGGSNVVATLAQGASLVCQATETAQPGVTVNTGRVAADGPSVTEPDGTVVPINVVDDARAAYTGIAPAITIVKTVQGDDANAEPGPLVPVGSNVAFSFTVTNSGDVPLSNVTVTDDQLADGNIDCGTGSNVVPSLAAGGVVTCTATTAATAGQHTDTGSAAGIAPATVDQSGAPVAGAAVTATDLGHYFGGSPRVAVVKQTNGQDGASAPGPYVSVGDPVSWTYTVTNPGNVTLTNLTVVDSPAVTIDCGGGSNVIATLEPGGPEVVCTATGTATAGQYTNTATVTAATPSTVDATGATVPGASVTGTDTSHYFGAGAAITVEKRVQGQDADAAPGPYVPVGDPVAWTFVVTNSGNVALTGVSVADSKLTATCPTTTLAVGASLTCTASGAAVAGQQSNSATASGTGPARTATDGSTQAGVTVTSADDAAYYFGGTTGLTLAKTINGSAASASAPGVLVAAGSSMAISIVITNTGNNALTNVTVTDSKLATALDCGGGSNVVATLAAGASATCTGTAVAPTGAYTNTASASGMAPAGTDASGNPVPGATVTATPATAYAFGTAAAVTITKTANGQAADTGGGPLVPVGQPVTFVYTVTNTGNVALSGVSVTDSRIAAGSITCTGGTGNGIATLAPTATLTCTATEAATAGTVENTGTVNATAPTVTNADGTTTPVSATDSNRAAYTGISPAVSLVKSVQGSDANTAPGPLVAVGDTAGFDYKVTNSGNVVLSSVTVTDNRIAAAGIDCGSGTNVIAELQPGATATCGATETATADAHVNTGTVTATAPDTTTSTGATTPGVTVRATDVANYFGGAPRVGIAKQTNGLDAAAAPGPYISVGDPVAWTFTVTNPGNVTLTALTITDNPTVTIVCPSGGATIASLDPGASVECTATGTATAGQFENTATVTGTSPATVDSTGAALPAGTVTSSDVSHYFGVAGSLTVEKRVQGDDADTAPGPNVPVGDALGWTFVVTNTSNVELTAVAITDATVSGVTCPLTTLAAGASTTCTASGVAAAGAHTNSATASGTGPARTGTTGAAEAAVRYTSPADEAHYFGTTTGLTLAKTINGSTASESAPGVLVASGSSMAISVVATNTGNSPLTDVTVTDSKLAAGLDCGAGTNVIATLAAGASVTCTGTQTAPEGSYVNTVSGTGTAPATVAADGSPVPGATVTATPDTAYAFGTTASVTITKTANGQAAATGDGPLVTVGQPVRFVYTVTNTSNTAIASVAVTDSRIASGSITCTGGTGNGIGVLAAGATLTCTATENASSGTVENTGTVNAVAPQVTNADGTTSARPVTDSNRAAYTGIAPAITVVKSVQGADANTAPGPIVPVGDALSFAYAVTNSGTVALTDVTVTDNTIADGSINCGTGSNVVASLAAGASVTCTAPGTAVAGSHTNVGTATGQAPDTVAVDGSTVAGVSVSDTDSATYFGGAPAVAVVKQTNGVDGADAPGPYVNVGDPVRWTFAVTNPGNLTLTNVTVVDDPAVNVECPGGGPTIASLAPGAAAVVCVATGTAAAGQFEDTVTVTAATPDTTNAAGATVPGASVQAGDTSHYFGLAAALTVEKRVQGDDADAAPGPYVPVGDPIAWSFVVTNSGNIALTDIAVNDPDVTVTCPETELAVGASTTCTASGTAKAGQQTNSATVSGTTPARTGPTGATQAGIRTTSEPDAAYYFGGTTGLTLVKRINGSAASGTAPGVLVPADSTMSISVVATNTGNNELRLVTVTDDQGVTLNCGDGTNVISTLAAGKSATCTGTTTAPTGPYTNEANASATAPDSTGPDGTVTPGATVVADPATAYAYGYVPQLTITKSVDGEAADTAPGPRIDADGTTTVTYRIVVENPDVAGAIAISNVAISDAGAELSCTRDGTAIAGTDVATLAVGSTLVCTSTVTALPGQQVNTATVSGSGPTPTNPDGTPGVNAAVTGSNAAYYFGATADLTLTTITQGTGDAGDNEAPGPLVRAGAPVRFTYVVTNPDVAGAAALDNVTLSDPKLVGGTIDCGSGNATIATLARGASATCVVNGSTAVEGQYSSTVTAAGTVGDVVTTARRANAKAAPGDPISATSPVHYYGVKSSLSVVTKVNGQDQDTGNGVKVDSDTAEVSWAITNTGNYALSGIKIDTAGLSLVGGITCTPGSLDDPLQPGDTITCTATVRVKPGETVRTDGTVTAEGPATADVNGAAVAPEQVSSADPIVISRDALPSPSPSPSASPTSTSTGNGGNDGDNGNDGDTGTLPNTGSDVALGALLAALLLTASGASMLLGGRRRRH